MHQLPLKLTSNRASYLYIVLVFFIILFAFYVRSDNLDKPLLDAHYFRQTQTATVVRNFNNFGIDFLHTRLDILGLDEHQILLLEFPFYQSIVAFFYFFFPSLDKLGRLVSIFFGIFSGLGILLLVREVTRNSQTGLVAMVFFLFFPLNIFFQQTFMIESTVVALHIFSLYSWIKFVKHGRNLWLIISVILTTLAFLQKSIYAPFLLLPIVAVATWGWRRKKIFDPKLVIGLIAPVIIILLWQTYVNLENTANGHEFFTLTNKNQQEWNFGTLADRFSTKIWKIRLASIQNSITKFTEAAFVVGLLALITKKLKGYIIWLGWLLSIVFYYLIFFRIHSHDYYLMSALPIVAIVASFGLLTLTEFVSGKVSDKKYRQPIPPFLIAVFLLIFSAKAVTNARPYFALDDAMDQKLKIINSALMKDGYVIFVFPEYDWNSVYTYYTKRRGVALGSKSLTAEKILDLTAKGYVYLIFDGYTQAVNLNTDIPNLLKDYSSTKVNAGIKIFNLYKS